MMSIFSASVRPSFASNWSRKQIFKNKSSKTDPQKHEKLRNCLFLRVPLRQIATAVNSESYCCHVSQESSVQQRSNLYECRFTESSIANLASNSNAKHCTPMARRTFMPQELSGVGAG